MSTPNDSRALDVIFKKLDGQSDDLNEIKVNLAKMQENAELRLTRLEKNQETTAARVSGLVFGFVGAVVTAIGTWLGQHLIGK